MAGIGPTWGVSCDFGVPSFLGVSTALGVARSRDAARDAAAAEGCRSCSAAGGTSGCGGLALGRGDLDLTGAAGGGGGPVNSDVPLPNLGCQGAALMASTFQFKSTPSTVPAGCAFGLSYTFGSNGGGASDLRLLGSYTPAAFHSATLSSIPFALFGSLPLPLLSLSESAEWSLLLL